MTNREYMAKLLTDPDWIDDGGSAYLSMVEYNIGCPYFVGDERCHCRKMDREPSRRECGQCKLEWLEAEVDE